MLITKSDRILVTGGTGFLGNRVVKKLEEAGASPHNIIAAGSHKLDLLRSRDEVWDDIYEIEPTIVIHLAAVVGGIGANREKPGEFFYKNMLMGMNIIDACREWSYTNSLKKFVFVGSICSYPKFCPVPFQESDLWNGYPEETNAPYGIAKKALIEMVQAYRNQYHFNGICLLPVNLYGPGDSLNVQTNHVIPALIIKFLKAKEGGEQSVALWGSGTPTREFLYVDDCADGIVKALMHYDAGEPVNLGTGAEISIDALANIISDKVGYKGRITYDRSMPDGQPRRCLSVHKAWHEFGFEAETKLSDGLDRTIQWVKESLS
jgi:GDP-L-fucose synthase